VIGIPGTAETLASKCRERLFGAVLFDPATTGKVPEKH
jgi:hypothetical protein